MKKILFCLTLAAIVFSCSKIIPGFLSPTLGYTDKTIVCKRGLALVQSQKVNFDGSTSPIDFKLLELRDTSGGKLPPEFTQTYDVLQFKPGQTFDPTTDTTIDLVNAKRENIKTTPFVFSESTGQFTFNRASGNLPIGTYPFDLSAKNIHGQTMLHSAGVIKVQDPTDDDLFVQNSTASSGFSDLTGASTAAKVPIVSFQKQSTDGARIILKIVDKNGRPFNPKAGEIITRGGRPSFENYAKFHPIIFTDTAMICDFEVAPFPLAHYVDAVQDWQYLMYYRIPSQFVAIDGMPAPTGYSDNPYVNFQIKLEGTYVVQVKLLDATHQ